MPYRLTVDHETVFDVLHAALLHGAQEVFFLDIVQEDMLVFFENDLLAVALQVLEKIFAALFEPQRMEFMIKRIPVVLIRDRINIVNTGIIHQQ